MIVLEQIKLNAELMSNKGLDKKHLEIAKESFEKAKELSSANTHIMNEKPIAEILGIFGGNIKGINVLDLGCGNGRDYAPILPIALSYLGANVTGVDYFPYRNDNDRKILSKKWGFQYQEKDLTRVYLFDSYGEIFRNKNLVIARSLLDFGLKEVESGTKIGTYAGLSEEWAYYVRIIKRVQEINSKDLVYNLEIPTLHHFYDTQKIYKSSISDKEKNKLINDYLTKEFESEFGKIIYGEKKSLAEVFVIKKFNK